MRRFVTRSHNRALHIALIFGLLLGCKGRISTREGVPPNDVALEAARAHDKQPAEAAAKSGVRRRLYTQPDAGVAGASTALAQRPRFQCTSDATRGTAQLAARRLTRDEYLLSVQAALGVDITKLPDVQQLSEQIPAETVGDITREFQNAHAYAHVAGILMTAQALAKAVVTDASARAQVFGDCAKGSETDRDCLATFLRGDARRILKRPLDAERVNGLLQAFSDIGEGPEGLQLVLARLLQAPEAVFHLAQQRQGCAPEALSGRGEQCQEDLAPSGRLVVDPWTVAARVAYALTGRGPDDALLDAAARDELQTPEQVRPHALRLLKTKDARRQLEVILDAWLNLQTLPTPTQAIAQSAGVDTLDLSSEARRELIDYALYEVLDREADAQTLMTAPVGFPRSKRMAKLYGSSKLATADEPVALSNGHRGLLLRIAPLLSGQLRTSPIMRGVYVRKRLLCDQLPSPDFSVVQARAQALHDMDPTLLSSRQLAEQITAPAECMACHTQINPLGFALEGFDAVGVKREVEVDFDMSGNQLGEHLIDTQVRRANIEDGEPQQLADAAELVKLVAASGKYKACVAERLVAHAQLRQPAAADECTLSEVEMALREGKSVKDAWLAAVVNQDTFLLKAPESSP